MAKTITLKLTDRSENAETVIRNLIRLYDDEIESFSITDDKAKK